MNIFQLFCFTGDGTRAFTLPKKGSPSDVSESSLCNGSILASLSLGILQLFLSCGLPDSTAARLSSNSFNGRMSVVSIVQWRVLGICYFKCHNIHPTGQPIKENMMKGPERRTVKPHWFVVNNSLHSSVIDQSSAKHWPSSPFADAALELRQLVW